MKCIIYDKNTGVANSTSWENSLTGKIPPEMVNNTRDGDMVTSILIILNVPVDINNTDYWCRPSLTEQSSAAVIIVIGKEHIQRHTLILEVKKFLY